MGLFSFFKKQSDAQVQNQNQNLMGNDTSDQAVPVMPKQADATPTPPITPPVDTPVPNYQQPTASIPDAPADEAPESPANDTAGDSLDGAPSDSGGDSPDSSDSSSDSSE
jgi:hypothetical protein